VDRLRLDLERVEWALWQVAARLCADGARATEEKFLEAAYDAPKQR
jgi:hypothetical protein